MKKYIWILICIIEIPILFWCGKTRERPSQEWSMEAKEKLQELIKVVDLKIKFKQEVIDDVYFYMEAKKLEEQYEKDHLIGYRSL